MIRDGVGEDMFFVESSFSGFFFSVERRIWKSLVCVGREGTSEAFIFAAPGWLQLMAIRAIGEIHPQKQGDKMPTPGFSALNSDGTP